MTAAHYKLTKWLIVIGVTVSMFLGFGFIIIICNRNINWTKALSSFDSRLEIEPTDLERCNNRNFDKLKISFSGDYAKLIKDGSIDTGLDSGAFVIHYDAIEHPVDKPATFQITIEENFIFVDIFRVVVLPADVGVDQINYLNDITFAIAHDTATGTGWLLSRIGTVGYTYYLATNYHVIASMRETATLYYAYGNDPISTYVPSGVWKPFTSHNINVLCSEKGGTDLAIIQVNFGGSIDQETQARLNRYNTSSTAYDTDLLQPGKTKILKHYKKAKIYYPKFILGYPVYVTGFIKKKQHAIVDSQFVSSSKHEITNAAGKRFYDNTNQYLFASSSGGSWMSNGASGSAVLDYEYFVGAIYWGTIQFGGKKTQTPAASCFNLAYDTMQTQFLN